MALQMSRRAFARLSVLTVAPGVVFASERDAVAQTTGGPVRGRLEDGVSVFKGIPYGFHNLEKSAWAGTSPRAQALAAKVSDAWVAFARSGDPNTPALPEWPAYDRARRATMILDNACRAVTDPDAEIRRLWATV